MFFPMDDTPMLYNPPPSRDDSALVNRWIQRPLMAGRRYRFFFFPVKKEAINKYKIEVYTPIHLLIKKPMSSSKNKNGVPTVPYQAIDVSAADIRR